MKKVILKKLCALLAIVAVSSSLTACNTVQGVGRDIQRGGQALEKVAR